MSFRLLVNPSAANGRALRRLPAVTDELRRLGVDPVVTQTRSLDHARIDRALYRPDLRDAAVLDQDVGAPRLPVAAAGKHQRLADEKALRHARRPPERPRCRRARATSAPGARGSAPPPAPAPR